MRCINRVTYSGTAKATIGHANKYSLPLVQESGFESSSLSREVQTPLPALLKGFQDIPRPDERVLCLSRRLIPVGHVPEVDIPK